MTVWKMKEAAQREGKNDSREDTSVALTLAAAAELPRKRPSAMDLKIHKIVYVTPSGKRKVQPCKKCMNEEKKPVSCLQSACVICKTVHFREYHMKKNY